MAKRERERTAADRSREILRKLHDFEQLDDTDSESWADYGEKLSQAGSHAKNHAAAIRTAAEIDADFADTGRTKANRI